MSDKLIKCRLSGCDETFTPKNIAHVFHSPGCKAAWHRAQPLHSGVVVTAIESKTGKGGIDSVVRVSLDNRKQMAELFVPGNKYVLVPLNEELF